MLNDSIVDAVANANFKTSTDIGSLCNNLLSTNAASHQQSLNLLSQGLAAGAAAVNVANAARAADEVYIPPIEQAAASSIAASGQLAGKITELSSSVASMQETLRSVVRITPQTTPTA